MDRSFIPANATIVELEQKAAGYERQAARAQEPQATELRKTARILRGWIEELRSLGWSAARH